MKKKIITMFVIFAIMAITIGICSYVVEAKKANKEYTLSDYGVSLLIPKEFKQIDKVNNSQVLYLKNEEGIIISATELKGNFWSSRRYRQYK